MTEKKYRKDGIDFVIPMRRYNSRSKAFLKVMVCSKV